MASKQNISRRDLLRAGAALAATAALRPTPVRAVEGSDLRFVFVFARGGWDTTCVFSPMGPTSRVAIEADATPVAMGDLEFVDHPDRAIVRTFFETYGHRACVVDGLLVRSVNHTICERLVQTGSARTDRPDWPSILGSVAAADHALPSVVLAGPTNPGRLHRTSSIVGVSGQLQGLLDGTAWARGDRPLVPLGDDIDRRVDALVMQAALAHRARQGDPGWWRVADAEVDALGRLQRLRDDATAVRFDAPNFDVQTEVAVQMLAAGVARCVSVCVETFDTHGNNADQTTVFQRLFAGLAGLMARLDATPGRRGGTLADETVVVVQSEMGRTPYMNVFSGKDHWPYTAAMLLGPGIRGGVRFGGYDDMLSGLPMRLDTGEVRADGEVVTSEHVGAALLALAGLDPRGWVDVDPLVALLG